MEETTKDNVDHIFESIVGGNGRWQWKTTIVLFPLAWIAGYPLFLSIFAAYEPPHRCFIEGCDLGHGGHKVKASFQKFTMPKDHASSKFLSVASTFDPCHKFSTPTPFDPNSTINFCTPEHFDSHKKVACDAFVYDTSQMKSTLTTELDLVCQEDYKNRLLGTFLMVGLLLGSLIGGHVGDRFGRKNAIMVGALIITPSVILGGVIPNFYAYLFFRLTTCTALPIMWISGSTYSLEYFSPKARRLIICIRDIPIPQYLLVLLVYFNRDWQSLHLWTGFLCLLGLPIYFFVPESPRWLAGNGRKEEAEKIFLEIAHDNGKKVSPEQRKEIVTILEKISNDKDPNLNPLDMFRRDHVVKTLILLLSWITVCVGFYALTLNSTELSGDIVVNYLLATVADTPVCIVLYFTIDGIGRRYTLALSQTLLGASCVVLALLPKDKITLILVFYLIGKAAAGISFAMVYLVTAELFPTNLRAQAIGFCSMVSRIFGLSASFVPKLAEYWTPLPMLVLGIPTMIAGGLALLLAETSGRDLPSTLEDSKNIPMKWRRKTKIDSGNMRAAKSGETNKTFAE